MPNDETSINFLNQIVRTITENSNTTTDYYDVNLSGEKVFFKDDDDNNLYVNAQLFYDYLKKYFSKKMFTLESDNHPDTANNENGNDHIIIWNDTGFETRFEEYSDPTAQGYNREAQLINFEIEDNKKQING